MLKNLGTKQANLFRTKFCYVQKYKFHVHSDYERKLVRVGDLLS